MNISGILFFVLSPFLFIYMFVSEHDCVRKLFIGYKRHESVKEVQCFCVVNKYRLTWSTNYSAGSFWLLLVNSVKDYLLCINPGDS